MSHSISSSTPSPSTPGSSHVLSLHADLTSADAAKYQFVRLAWIAACESMVDEASKGSGLVYELYAERFSALVDHRLNRIPAEFRAQAIAIASQQFDYYTPEEARVALSVDDDDPNYCQHHLPYECCPLGCGDRDDICIHHHPIASCSMCFAQD